MRRITILYGAIREGRMSSRVAKAVRQSFSDAGAEVTLIDIKDYKLPVMESRLKDMQDPPAVLLEISEALKNADGIVFLSPEYNNSYSGAFKNAVDYFTFEWAKKPIGVVAASAGRQGGINASNLMQLLVLAIGAYAMPTKLLIPEIGNSIDENGVPTSEAITKSIRKFTEEMLWFTEAIKTQKEKGR